MRQFQTLSHRWAVWFFHRRLGKLSVIYEFLTIKHDHVINGIYGRSNDNDNNISTANMVWKDLPKIIVAKGTFGC